MHRKCWERFPRHRIQTKLPVNCPSVKHLTWCMLGSLTTSGGSGTFPAHVQPAILRIGQKTHGPVYQVSRNAISDICFTQAIFLCVINCTFSPLLAICEWRQRYSGFPTQIWLSWSFGVLFAHEQTLGIQPRRRWFETSSHSLWRHSNARESTQ